MDRYINAFACTYEKKSIKVKSNKEVNQKILTVNDCV